MITWNNKRPLRVQKRLLQFNNIPFAFGEVVNPTYSATFKGTTQSYTNATHGGYYPQMGQYGKLQVSQFDAELDFSFNGIECDDKVRYARFIRRQFAKSGKLFATQSGNEVIWTNARVVSINEVMSAPTQRDVLRLSVTFELVDGYWRYASRTRAFICEYCPASFSQFDDGYCIDATDFAGKCSPAGSIACLPCEVDMSQGPVVGTCDLVAGHPELGWKPLCNFSDKERAAMFGQNCANRYFINYSCDLENEYFCYDVPFGEKHHLKASDNFNETVINHCSKTDIPTSFIRMRLVGEFLNPSVRIQKPVGIDKKTNEYIYEDVDAIEHKFGAPATTVNGTMTIGFGPTITTSSSVRNSTKDVVDVTADYDKSNTPMFEFQPGWNRIVVTGNKLRKDSWLYIEEIPITY